MGGLQSIVGEESTTPLMLSRGISSNWSRAYLINLLEMSYQEGEGIKQVIHDNTLLIVFLKRIYQEHTIGMGL
jgi:hypothetical protein